MYTSAHIYSISLLFICCIALPTQGQTLVTSTSELKMAIQQAQPNEVIEVAAGLYVIDGNLVTQRSGQPSAPIVVRGSREGESILQFSRSDGGYVEGFKVEHAHWIFENLILEGSCEDHSKCEHAWHIAGDADHLIIRDNIARDFNAHIKANRNGSDQDAVFADDVLVEGNEFYNRTVRETSNPVTPIDVVGGRRWIIRANFIHDHAKGQGNEISYAAFLKGNSKEGLIEKNLVICEWLHSGHIRLGLSFGGGGSNPDRICEEETCSPEHEDGLMINNIIVNCPTDVGIFVRECTRCQVHHNTLFNTTGIDFIENSVGSAYYNLLMGRIRDRQGSSSEQMGNLMMVEEDDFIRWFIDPRGADLSLMNLNTPFIDVASPLLNVTHDYCGQIRESLSDVGAIEYLTESPCVTQQPRAQNEVDVNVDMMDATTSSNEPPPIDGGMNDQEINEGDPPDSNEMNSGERPQERASDQFIPNESNLSDLNISEQNTNSSEMSTNEGCQSTPSTDSILGLLILFILCLGRRADPLLSYRSNKV